MNSRHQFIAMSAVLFIIAPVAAHAGGTINTSGALAQIVDKWKETEPEKGHKLVEYTGRCVAIPNEPAAPKATCTCTGNYEYMPDGSWKGAGSCTDTYQGETRRASRGRRARTSRSTPTNNRWHREVQSHHRWGHLLL